MPRRHWWWSRKKIDCSIIYSEISQPLAIPQDARSDFGIAKTVNTKHFYNICTFVGRRRWADVVQMSYHYFVFAGVNIRWLNMGDHCALGMLYVTVKSEISYDSSQH